MHWLVDWVGRAEIRRYKLADFDPPKHVYVTTRDVKTDQLYESQYVSKRLAKFNLLTHC